MGERVLGLLLFLPVPLVLFLFTQAPLGGPRSLVLGVALMATHRLYARPFALVRAQRRCLWCGGKSGSERRESIPALEPRGLTPLQGCAPEPPSGVSAAGPELIVEEPPGTTRWGACGEPHEQRARRFLGWAGAHRRFVQIGILGTLAAFLVLAVLAALRPGAPLRREDAVNVFRLGIAATVLPLSILGLRGPVGSDRLRTPFPVHIQALIGTWPVIWLFRIVGATWLTLALVYFARRV